MPRLPVVRAAAAAALAALPACATISRPPVTLPALVAATDTVARLEAAAHAAIVDRLAARAVRRGDATLDVLMLSGGGQFGAFGAGFLSGWRARTDAPMPTFDLVTGVSTGALQAPFAAIGTPALLDTLRALYRTSVDRFAPRLDLLAATGLRRTGGAFGMGRYTAMIAQVYDDTLRAALARARAQDRQVVVTTTDMDVGRVRTWELGALLARPDGAAALHRALVGSSAIPGAFPPVLIDGHVHSDGGVMGNLAPVLDLAAMRRLAERLRAAGIDRPVTVRTWIVMNTWLESPPAVVDPASRRAIGARSNAVMFWQQQRALVTRYHELAAAVTGTVPGLRMEVRHVAMPQALDTAPGSAALFDRAFMARLDSLGRARALSATPWDAPFGATHLAPR